MRTVWCLRADSEPWYEQQKVIVRLSAAVGRSINYDCISPIEVTTSQLQSLKLSGSGRGPIPPELHGIHYSALHITVVLLLSVDIGTGTLKFIAKFVLKNYSEEMSHFLCWLGYAVYERNLLILLRYLSLFRLKLIRFSEMEYLFVGDFKAVYSLTGGVGSCDIYLCPYCVTKLVHTDKSRLELYNTEQYTSYRLL